MRRRTPNRTPRGPMSDFEAGFVTGAILVTLVCLAALSYSSGCRAAEPRTGLFALTVRYSHHASLVRWDVSVLAGDQGYVDLVDQVEVVNGFRTEEACHAAGLEHQARFQRPERNAYVDFTCSYLGRP